MLIGALRGEGELDDGGGGGGGLDVRRLAAFIELGPASLAPKPNDLDDAGSDGSGSGSSSGAATDPPVEWSDILARAEAEAKAAALGLEDIASTSTKVCMLGLG